MFLFSWISRLRFTCQPENVPPPTAVLPGQTVDFTCLPGWKIGGASSSTCLEDGSWTNAAPVCLPVTCGAPPAISNSHVTLRDVYNAGDIVTYTCDLGYEVEGASSLLCGNDGSWTGIYPRCIDVVCDSPPTVEHASVIGREAVGAGSTPAGGWVQYMCWEGFMFDEGHDGRVSCLRGGSWSSDIPRCIHIDCGPPPVPFHASVISSGTTAGSLATVECNRGYRLPDGGQRLEVVCDISGTWAGAENALCVPVNCFQPPPVANSAPFGNIATTYGSQLSYQCLPGYELIGDAAVQCSEGGVWVSTGQELPACSLVNCGPPETDLLVTGSDFTFGSTVTLTCPEGWRVVGSDRVTCTSDGDWSPEPGTCDSKCSFGFIFISPVFVLMMTRTFCDGECHLLSGAFAPYVNV